MNALDDLLGIAFGVVQGALEVVDDRKPQREDTPPLLLGCGREATLVALSDIVEVGQRA
jgi:predicted outer membrane lipoprotein